ncbi:iron transporter [Rhodoferax ferrireducens]|uniref:iron transporter n=1 Tax=Rhodoferax ferrireducens TaxID=192843 RepID=UPI000E0DBEB0|nr:iron transporter [Rhodoferax ferrireducens]
MTQFHRTALTLALAAACAGSGAQTSAAATLSSSKNATAQLAEPKVEKLAIAADPIKKAVLIGRVTTGDMIFQLELEGSEPMWMQMGNPPAWGAHKPGADERYHVELKLTDPKSKTRIPYANINFAATNKETGKTVTLPLPPMWGSSGLHYSANSALLGDGTYTATVTVDVPTFQRELKDKDLWSKAVSARFHFRLADGKLTEVSQASR